MTDCAQKYFLDKSLAEECSGELEISNGFIVGRLTDAWPEFRENAENVRIKSIGTENISNVPDLCNVIRIIVTFSDGKTQTAVLKLLPKVVELEKYLPKGSDVKWDNDAILNTYKKAHNQEVEFYRLFGSQNGSKIEGFPMAKIYYSNKSAAATVEESNGIPPMLIMEDLGDMAFKCGTKFNEEQSRSILTHLAMFHKHLLCLDNDEWKNGFEKQHWFEPEKQLQALENKKMGSLQALFEELKNALQTKEDFFRKAKEFLSAPALPEILVLGDMNPGNVLFSKAEPTQVYAFIDFQTVSLGNIVHDVHKQGTFARSALSNGISGGMATITARLKHTNEDYRTAFAYFDMNKDGQITAAELESAMNKCGVFPTKLELRIIMNQMDKDKNGVITFEEFVQMMRLQEKEQLSQIQANQKRIVNLSSEHPEIRGELLDQFRLFDKDNDGFILPQEMQMLVKELRLGKSFPANLVEQLFKEADNDGDGKISFEEFVLAVI